MNKMRNAIYSVGPISSKRIRNVKHKDTIFLPDRNLNIFYSLIFKSISTDFSKTMILDTNNGIWATGFNDDGELGLGDTVDRSIFTKVGIDSDWLQISGGEWYSVALKNDHSLWVTGDNTSGQLGLGDNNNRSVFTKVGVDIDWMNVFGGGDHLIVQKMDGTFWSTGDNYYGQLGLGDYIDRNVLTQIGTDTDWIHTSKSWFHTHAIKANGSLWATGRNNEGQLGLGDEINRNVFVQVGTDTDWTTSAYGGDTHSAFLKADGTIWVTGSNGFGQLGLGDVIDRSNLTQVTGLPYKCIGLDAGDRFTIALLEDHTIWGTGYNGQGQLGFAGDDHISFIKLSNDTDWAAIYCGGLFSYFIKTNGEVYVTGDGLECGIGVDSPIYNITLNSFFESESGTGGNWKGTTL